MLRAEFCIFGIDSIKINLSISATAQFYMIIILIVTEMRNFPKEDFVPLGWLYKQYV